MRNSDKDLRAGLPDLKGKTIAEEIKRILSEIHAEPGGECQKEF